MSNTQVRKDYSLLISKIKEDFYKAIEWDKDDRLYVLKRVIKKYIPNSATNRYSNNILDKLKKELL